MSDEEEAEESDDEVDSEIEEELGYLSPLDLVNPYATFKQALTGAPSSASMLRDANPRSLTSSSQPSSRRTAAGTRLRRRRSPSSSRRCSWRSCGVQRTRSSSHRASQPELCAFTSSFRPHSFLRIYRIKQCVVL